MYGMLSFWSEVVTNHQFEDFIQIWPLFCDCRFLRLYVCWVQAAKALIRLQGCADHLSLSYSYMHYTAYLHVTTQLIFFRVGTTRAEGNRLSASTSEHSLKCWQCLLHFLLSPVSKSTAGNQWVLPDWEQGTHIYERGKILLEVMVKIIVHLISLYFSFLWTK